MTDSNNIKGIIYQCHVYGFKILPQAGREPNLLTYKKHLPNSEGRVTLEVNELLIHIKTSMCLRTHQIRRIKSFDDKIIMINDKLPTNWRFKLENNKVCFESSFPWGKDQNLKDPICTHYDDFLQSSELLLIELFWKIPQLPEIQKDCGDREYWHMIIRQIFTYTYLPEHDSRSILHIAKIPVKTEQKYIYIYTIIAGEYLVVYCDTISCTTNISLPQNVKLWGKTLEIAYIYPIYAKKQWKKHYLDAVKSLLQAFWITQAREAGYAGPHLRLYDLVQKSENLSYTTEFFCDEMEIYTKLRKQDELSRFCIQKVDRIHKRLYYTKLSEEQVYIRDAILAVGYSEVADSILKFVMECQDLNIFFKKIKLNRFVFGRGYSVKHLPIELSECCYIDESPPVDYTEQMYMMIIEKLLSYLQKFVKTNKTKSMLYIDPSEVRISTKSTDIYQGNHSQVYWRCIFLGNSAVAKVNTSNKVQQQNHDVIQEFNILSSLQHDGVVRYYGHTTAVNENCIILESCPGNLKSIIQQRRSLGGFTYFLKRLASAIQYCHSREIWHMSISPGNILITTSERYPFQPIPKLTGFGYDAAHMAYAAPEFRQNPNLKNRKWDVWSFGAVLYSILAQQVIEGPQDIQLMRIDSEYNEILQLWLEPVETRPEIVEILHILNTKFNQVKPSLGDQLRGKKQQCKATNDGLSGESSDNHN